MPRKRKGGWRVEYSDVCGIVRREALELVKESKRFEKSADCQRTEGCKSKMRWVQRALRYSAKDAAKGGASCGRAVGDLVRHTIVLQQQRTKVRGK